MHMYVCSVYKESLRHCLSIGVKDHKFWRFKAHLYNHHSSKHECIPDAAQFAFVPKHCLNVVPHEKITIHHDISAGNLFHYSLHTVLYVYTFCYYYF